MFFELNSRRWFRGSVQGHQAGSRNGCASWPLHCRRARQRQHASQGLCANDERGSM